MVTSKKAENGKSDEIDKEAKVDNQDNAAEAKDKNDDDEDNDIDKGELSGHYL